MLCQPPKVTSIKIIHIKNLIKSSPERFHLLKHSTDTFLENYMSKG